jgi:CRP/FNR family cyclic AMP-dependent transcriptional regulator
MAEVLAALLRIPWLAGLPKAALEVLGRHAVRRPLRRRQALFEEGQRFDWVAVVLRGSLQLSRRAGARQLRLRDLQVGAVLGTSLVAGAPTGVTALAGEADTQVLLVPGSEVRAALRQHPAAALEALSHLAGLVETLTEELAEARTLRLEDRVHRHLLRLGRGRREVQVTQQALADALGASRERVNRALKALEQQGALSRHRGRIELGGEPVRRRHGRPP